jgi:DNA-binding Lrp family transcriptional regulator
MPAKPLDEVDQRLLARLQDDARTPLAALAREVGLSRSAIQERLARLERNGVVAGYTVKLGPAVPVGVEAWLLLRYAAGFSCDDVMPELASWPEVRAAHSVAGDTDLMVRVRADTPAALARLRERAHALKGVDDVTTVPVLEVKLER